MITKSPSDILVSYSSINNYYIIHFSEGLDFSTLKDTLFGIVSFRDLEIIYRAGQVGEYIILPKDQFDKMKTAIVTKYKFPRLANSFVVNFISPSGIDRVVYDSKKGIIPLL